MYSKYTYRFLFRCPTIQYAPKSIVSQSNRLKSYRTLFGQKIQIFSSNFKKFEKNTKYIRAPIIFILQLDGNKRHILCKFRQNRIDSLFYFNFQKKKNRDMSSRKTNTKIIDPNFFNSDLPISSVPNYTNIFLLY